MDKPLIKSFRKYPRRSKQLYTNLIAAIFSGFPIAMLFAIIWKGPTYLDWETNSIRLAFYLVFTTIILYLFYKLGRSTCPDEKERNTFFDSFLMGIPASIVVSVLIIFKEFVNKSTVNWIIVFLAFLIISFICPIIVLNKIKVRTAKDN